MLSHATTDPSVQSFNDLHEYFQALGDVARLRIVDHLAGSSGELRVSDLAYAVRMSQPLCSWHLRRLVRIGIVRVRRVGREARCSLNRARLEEYGDIVARLLDERYPSSRGPVRPRRHGK